MLLRGSCHCGAVAFTLKSTTPYPYMRCYCSICRKTGGGGGYAINIMGEAATLKVKGKAALSVYRARIGSGKGQGKTTSTGRRHFCSHCGSALWVADPRWPDWVYPFASAIDSKLPPPPQHCNIMLDFAAPWADVPKAARKNAAFARYPDGGIMDWHQKRGLVVK
ncbi:MAG: GFA family protein [Betaproteobacteria bacterium]